MSPTKFSTRKALKVLLQLNTSKYSGSDGIPAIGLKFCAPELPLFSTSCSNFLTILVLFLPLGSSPTFSLFPTKMTSLTFHTIALLQALVSSLRLWRPLSPNNCLPSLKQTIFFLTIKMDFDEPHLPVTF